jgi:hypothetical protein
VEKALQTSGCPRLVPWRNHLRADILKNAVRLTFPKGAQMKDPQKLFNTRLDSKTVRAIDFHESDLVDESALKELILDAVGLNTAKERAR